MISKKWDATFERLLKDHPHMMSKSFEDGLRIGSPELFTGEELSI